MNPPGDSEGMAAYLGSTVAGTRPGCMSPRRQSSPVRPPPVRHQEYFVRRPASSCSKLLVRRDLLVHKDSLQKAYVEPSPRPAPMTIMRGYPRVVAVASHHSSTPRTTVPALYNIYARAVHSAPPAGRDETAYPRLAGTISPSTGRLTPLRHYRRAVGSTPGSPRTSETRELVCR